jgi:CRP-like cAMP-binding protein
MPGMISETWPMDTTSLHNVVLFDGLPDAAIEDIHRRCSWRRFAAGELVFDRESDKLDVFFVVEGRVRILNVVSEERELALADIAAGNYFGELAAIDGMRRSARVVAIEESLLASLAGPAFFQAMQAYPVIAVKVMERLTRIIRDLDVRVTEISMQSESQRIWAQLVRLAELDADGGGWIIRDVPSHSEIAAWSGTKREQVAQAIGDLARDGIVRRRNATLVVHDLQRLKLMIGYQNR